VPTSHENLKPWELAFLGAKPLLKTSVFWQCTTGLLYALTQIYFSATLLHTHEPKIYSRWWPLFAVLVIAVLCLSWNFLTKASKLRALLQQNKGQPAYEDYLSSAKSLALNYFTLTMGLGLAILIARFVYGWP
jgi:hypothetical protein